MKSVLLLLAGLPLFFGCAHNVGRTNATPGSGSAEAPKASSGTFAQKWGNKSPAEGLWAGTWTALGANGEGKFIGANCMEMSDGIWVAKFDAVCSSDFTFRVTMNGREDAGKVLFDGVADLQKHGVYTWTGEVFDGLFTGKYEGNGHKGSFRMTKVAVPDPAIAATCTDPTAATGK